jgi:hypothetical protein
VRPPLCTRPSWQQVQMDQILQHVCILCWDILFPVPLPVLNLPSKIPIHRNNRTGIRRKKASCRIHRMFQDETSPFSVHMSVLYFGTSNIVHLVKVNSEICAELRFPTCREPMSSTKFVCFENNTFVHQSPKRSVANPKTILCEALIIASFK